MSGVVTVLWVVYSIGVWIVYHKIFEVYYFNLAQGLMKELFLSAFLGLILTGLTLSLWWLAAIILLLVGLGVSGKAQTPSGKHTIIALFVIAAIIISIVGISFNSRSNRTEFGAAPREYAVEKIAV